MNVMDQNCPPQQLQNFNSKFETGQPGCDFLVCDWEGRLPSEIAREYGHDRAMARLLLIKEVR